MIRLFLSLVFFAGQAVAQCPPGVANCPNPTDRPASPASGKTYTFRGSPEAPPWSTVARVSWTVGARREIGTGTLIRGDVGDGLVMTAAHVVKGAPGEVLVELFGSVLDLPSRSVGPPIASYRGRPVDRDDGLDVGLVRFAPSKPLAVSRLVPRGWRPERGESLCSIGCSLGADPTAGGVEYRGESRLEGKGNRYLGYECSYQPEPGRSGGGLFTDKGLLAGVCDFADPKSGTGIYAQADSIRQLLARNGLVELAEGTSATRRPPPAPPASNPSPAPAPFEPLVAEAASWLPTALAGGVPTLGALGLAGWSLRRKAAAPAALPSLSPEVLLAMLRESIRSQDLDEAARIRREEQAKADRAMVDQLRAMLRPAGPAVPNP